MLGCMIKILFRFVMWHCDYFRFAHHLNRSPHGAISTGVHAHDEQSNGMT